MLNTECDLQPTTCDLPGYCTAWREQSKPMYDWTGRGTPGAGHNESQSTRMHVCPNRGQPRQAMAMQKRAHSFQAQRMPTTQTERSSVTASPPKWLPGQSQRPELLPSLLHARTGLGAQAILHCFARHVNTELEQKRSSHTSDRCPYGILALQATALVTPLQCQPQLTNLSMA